MLFEKLENHTTQSTLHFLPCVRIDQNGPANVDRYFSSNQKEENGQLTNSLYGRKLLGKKVEMGDVKGIVYQVKNNEILKPVEQFNSFTVWNQQYPLTQQDSMIQLIDYMNAIKAVNFQI